MLRKPSNAQILARKRFVIKGRMAAIQGGVYQMINYEGKYLTGLEKKALAEVYEAISERVLEFKEQTEELKKGEACQLTFKLNSHP